MQRKMSSPNRYTTAIPDRFDRSPRSALLLGNTDSSTPPARSLRMLASNAQSPIMTQPTMRADLLQPLQVLAEFAVDAVGVHLGVLAVHDIALSVEEPGGYFVLGRVLDDGDDALQFFGCDFSGTGEDMLR